MINKVIVMVGPSLNSKGGIASVVCAYESAGLFKKWPVIYLSSHVEGSKGKKLAAVFTALKSFAALLALRRVSVLHVHVAADTSFWRKSIFIVLAYVAKRPVFVHLHSGGFPEFYWSKCSTVQKRAVQFILDRADRIIVLSSQWWGLLEGVTKNTRITKIPNFIVEVHNQPMACEREKNSVLFLGRLCTEKGFFDLLEAAAIVRQHFPTFKLRCGGEGDMNKATLRIKKLGIDSNVELLGWVGDEERLKWLNSTTTLVLPSYVEGLPMAVIEAMSRGVPVVASNVGGIPDVIDDGKEGLLIRPGDVKGIANALIYLLENPVERDRLGEAGKQKVDQQFIAARVVPYLENMYKEYRIVPHLNDAQWCSWQNRLMNGEKEGPQ